MAKERIHASQNRLGFLDWTRGLAALVMLQGHVFHSFMAKDLRDGSHFILSQFLGGMPPAYFLFLTGVTLAFLMDSLCRKQLPDRDRFLAALARARYLIVVAILFRLQLWVFAWGQSPWTDLLKVDVLNCMGVTMALLSPLVFFSSRQRMVYGAVVGLIFSCGAPLVSNADLSALPELVRAYLTPSPVYFALFPWSAFLAFGLSAGSVIRIVPHGEFPRLLQWAALLGLGLIVGATYFANIPYSVYTKSEFWLDSPALVFVKSGVVLFTLAVAWVWLEFNEGKWSWLATLGQHSLPVYWVHIELVYGRWFGSWKESLGLLPTTLMAVVIIGAMVVMAESLGRYYRGEFPRLRLVLNRIWPLGAG